MSEAKLPMEAFGSKSLSSTGEAQLLAGDATVFGSIAETVDHTGDRSAG